MNNQPKPVRRRRRLLTFIAVPVVAVVALYILLTSSLFLTGIVLPWIGKIAGVELGASSIDLSLFKLRLDCRGLRVGPAARPVVKTERILARVSLRDFSFPIVKELEVEGLEGHLSQDASGRWNLAPMNTPSQAARPKSKTAQSKSKSSKSLLTLPLGVEKLSIRATALSFSSEVPGETCNFVASDAVITLNHLLPGEPAALTLNTGLVMNTGNLNIERSRLELTAETTLKNLLPADTTLKITLNDLQGTLNRLPIAGNRMEIDAKAALNGNHFNFSQFSATEFNGDRAVAMAGLNAEGDLEPFKVKFKISAAPVPPLLIAMLEPHLGGLSLGRLDVHSEGTASWQERIFTGSSATSISHRPDPKRERQLPQINLRLSQDLTVDLPQHTIAVRSLTFGVEETGRRIIGLELKQPFLYNWKDDRNNAAAAPSLSLTVERFDLQQLHLLLTGKNTPRPRGLVSAELTTGLNHSDRRIAISGRVNLRDFAIAVPGFSPSGLAADLTFRALTREFTDIFLPEFNLELKHADRVCAALSGAANFNHSERRGNFKLKLHRLGHDTLTLLKQAGIPLGPAPQLSQQLSPYRLELSTTGSVDLSGHQVELQTVQLELNRGTRGKLLLSPLSPPILNWKSSDLLAVPIRAGVKTEKFDLVFLNLFTGEHLKVKNGQLSSELNVTYQPGRHRIDAEGALDLRQADLMTGGKRYHGFDFREELKADFQPGRLTITNARSTVTITGNTAADLKTSGHFDFSSGGFELNNNIIKVDHNAVRVALDAPSPVTFLLTGKLSVARAGAGTAPAIRGELVADRVKSPQLTHPLKIELGADISPESGRLDIRRCAAVIHDGRIDVVNLAVNGQIATPLNRGKTDVTIKTTRLDLMTLENLLRAPETSSQSPAGSAAPAATTKTPTEPAPIQLGANAMIRLELDGISYGPNLQASCHDSQISIQRSRINTEKMNLMINRTPIALSGNTDLGQSDGYPFSVACRFKNFNAAPLIAALSPQDSQSIRAQINNFDTTMTGKGFTPANLDRNLKGKIKLDASNMSFPNSLKNLGYFRILLLPVEIVAKIINYIPQLNNTSDLSEAISKAQAIYNNTNNLNLQSGQINLDISGGYLQLNQFDFTGDFIQKLSFRGRLPLQPSNPMNIDSSTTVAYLTIPLTIQGTLNNPSPNIPRMVAAIVQTNLSNLINAKPVKSIIGEADNLLKQTGKIIQEGIQGPNSNNNSNQNKSGGTPSLPQLLDNLLE